MRCTVGNDDDVAFSNGERFAILHTLAANFFGLDTLAFYDSAAGHEGRRALEHVDNVRVFAMHFYYARRVAVAGMNFIIGEFEQRHAFLESFAHLSRGEVSHLR